VLNEEKLTFATSYILAFAFIGENIKIAIGCAQHPVTKGGN
jgi:hypothetical protein